MTSRSLTFVHTAVVALLLVLAPAPSRSQEPQQPAVPPQEKAAETPGRQTPSEATTPEEKPVQQQGEVIIPKQGQPVPEPAETASAPAAKEEGKYTIKQGDTLWDISNAFLKDPFLWPFLWKANPYIANPDLIYPGNRLVIPSMAPIEQALQAPAEEQAVEKQAPAAEQAAPEAPFAMRKPSQAAPEKTEEEEKAPASRLILPEEAAIPIMDKYSMLNAGFVNQDESRDLIVGSLEEKNIFGYDDIVYVTVKSTEANIGDKFLIYQPLDRVRHPVTGRNYGTLIKVLGVLQITAKGKKGVDTARITISFDAAERGSMLTPYQEPTLIYNTTQTKPKDISGYILQVMDGRSINAQTDIVYLDKGNDDGVEPGDRFLIYAKPQKGTYPTPLLGEAQVFLVKEKTSTAVVRKSVDTIARGDKIEFKK